jgi:hypothetical protein
MILDADRILLWRYILGDMLVKFDLRLAFPFRKWRMVSVTCLSIAVDIASPSINARE